MRFRLLSGLQRDGRPLIIGVLVAAMLATILPITSQPALAAPTITIGDHEGQENPSGTWTNGQVKTYAEGDLINFRFTVHGDEATAGTVDLRFSGPGASGCVDAFFDQYFTLGPVQAISGTVPIVAATAPIASGNLWVVTLSFDFAGGAGEARVGYTLRVNDDVFGCNGSSTSTEFDSQSETGDMANPGTQNVPVPAKDIVRLPDITVTKLIDRDGDGSSDGPAEAGEFGFALDGGTVVPVDTNGQVVFQNIEPDGPHTITETQLSEANGIYEFLSGSGDECVVDGSGVGTATIAASPNNPTHATCTFLNTLAARPPSLHVVKSANPLSLDETGGSFVYTVTVENDSVTAATLDSLVDDMFGDITQVHGAISATSCSVPRALGATDGVQGVGPDFTSCSFTATITGEAGFSHTNTVTATASNDRGSDQASDDATVIITDVPPSVTLSKAADVTELVEPGGTVTFTLTITNTSAETVVITALTDDHTLSAECLALISDSLEPGAGASCQYTVALTEAGTYPNTASVTVDDNDGSSASANDSATVVVNDVLPNVTLTKVVAPSSLPEPGGLFTFTLRITNTSVESVMIAALDDTYTLSAECVALVGASLEAGGVETCTYGVNLSDAGTYHNTASVAVSDGEGNQARDTAEATATVTGVAPTVTLTKSVIGSDSLPEPGGDFTFQLTVTNTSVEPVTITSLTDSQSAVADDFSDCDSLVSDVLAANGGSTSCTYVVAHSESGVYGNTAIVTVEDDDEEEASDSDSASVTVTDALPIVSLTKSVDPTERFEPGGDFAYTLMITNTSAEPVTIVDLNDDHVLSEDCLGLIGVPLTVGATTSCSYSVNLQNAGTYANTAVVTVIDDELNEATDQDEAQVVVQNVEPAMSVTKTPSLAEISEPGANVNFLVEVANLSGATDPIALTSLVDDVFGDLTALPSSSCSLVTIAPGDTYVCSFTAFIAGNVGDDHVNTLTVAGVDDEHTPAQDSADATVTISDLAPSVNLQKTPSTTVVPEPGEDVTFTVVVTNNSASTDPVTITSLSDDVHGDLNGQGDCSVPQAIPPGDAYTCSFTAFVAGNADDSETDTVTAVGTDDEGSGFQAADEATVRVTGSDPSLSVTKLADPVTVPEPGGDVTFTLTVDNTSVGSDPVELESLVDDVHGDLNGVGDCSTPQTILPSDSYTCSFTAFVGGDAGDSETDVVTATGEDDEGAEVSANDDATVSVSDVVPVLRVDKTVDNVALPEPGGDVEFTLTVTNDSVVSDPVLLVGLVDDIHGDLNGQGDCLLPQALSPGGDYTCSFTAAVVGDAGESETDIVTATAIDDEGNVAEGSDSATVTIVDVDATLAVVKEAFPTDVPEPGEEVTFTVSVQNTSNASDPVLIDSLVDDVYGDLSGQGDCTVPQELDPGEVYSCSFTAIVSGDAGDVEIDTVTASGFDDEENAVLASDEASVTVTDVLPTITVTKTADAATVAAPGDAVSFSVTIENTSPEEVTISTITDTVDGQVIDITTVGDPVTATTCATEILLAPAGQAGASTSCSFGLNVVGLGGESVSDLVEVEVVDNEENIGVASDTASVAVMPVADLSIDKTALATLLAGESVTYRLMITNSGPSTATNVVVSDELPDLVTFVSVSADDAAMNCSANGNLVACTMPALAAGASVEILIVVNVGDEAEDQLVVNTGLVGATESDPDLSNNTDSYEQLVPEVLGQVVTPTPTPTVDPDTDLPITGANSGRLMLWALLLILVGSALLLETHRVQARRQTAPRHGA